MRNLQDRPYSLNFDESAVNGDSQLNINVPYLTPERLVEKRCLTTVALQASWDHREGVSGDGLKGAEDKEH